MSYLASRADLQVEKCVYEQEFSLFDRKEKALYCVWASRVINGMNFLLCNRHDAMMVSHSPDSRLERYLPVEKVGTRTWGRC